MVVEVGARDGALAEVNAGLFEGGLVGGAELELASSAGLTSRRVQ